MTRGRVVQAAAHAASFVAAVYVVSLLGVATVVACNDDQVQSDQAFNHPGNLAGAAAVVTGAVAMLAVLSAAWAYAKGRRQ